MCFKVLDTHWSPCVWPLCIMDKWLTENEDEDDDDELINVVAWRLSPCLFLSPRVLPGAGQGDGSSDLQHQQHDGAGALHAAGPPLAAAGRQAHPLARTRSPPAHTHTHTHTLTLALAPPLLEFRNMCSKTVTHAPQTDTMMYCMHTHTHSSPLLLHTHTRTHTHSHTPSRDELPRHISNTVSIFYTSLPKTLSNLKSLSHRRGGGTSETAAQKQQQQQQQLHISASLQSLPRFYPFGSAGWTICYENI